MVYESNITHLTFDTKEGRSDLFGTGTFQTISCYLSDYDYNESDYDFNDDFKMNNDNNTTLYMSKDLKELYAMPACRSNDNVKVLLGNPTDQEKHLILLWMTGVLQLCTQ